MKTTFSLPDFTDSSLAESDFTFRYGSIPYRKIRHLIDGKKVVHNIDGKTFQFTPVQHYDLMGMPYTMVEVDEL